MRDQSPQPSPSQIIFPVQLQPAEHVEASVAAAKEPWGWLEVFVLSQVFWGILLFLPGSQEFRMYIRAFPYVASLVALFACARSTGTEMSVPGARWILAVIMLLIVNLVHRDTWLVAGVAQVLFQISIAAPVFWAGRAWVSTRRLERLLWLIFGANFVGAGLGLLQVYYPDTFLPGQFSTLALQLSPDFVSQLTYQGAGDRIIIRPPGLSDLPGGAAISATFAAVLAFGFAMRPAARWWFRPLYFGAVAVAVTCLYLTQVRSMLLMTVGSMFVVALIRLRQGRVLQSGWIAGSAAALVFGSFIWAVTLGGDVVQERFQDIVDTGVYSTYQENRGSFLDYTIQELPFVYPLGAGLGRWGMMSVYFRDPQAWQRPPIHAEIQPTGWLYDGGIPMWLFYGAALFVCLRRSYTLATRGTDTIHDFATMVFTVQLMILGLCLTGPVFNTQIGLLFWLITAVLYGGERTEAIEAWSDDVEAEAEADVPA